MSEEIDFEAAEKKAKEEAERIEKLGYDPEAEKADEAAQSRKTTAGLIEKTTIAAPTPITPPKIGYDAQPGHQRTPSEVERLGMGMGRLGFGQVGAANPLAAATGGGKRMGFGSVGTPRAVEGTLRLVCFESDGNLQEYTANIYLVPCL